MRHNLITYLTALIISALAFMGCSCDDVADGKVEDGGNTMMLRIGLAVSANHSRATSNPTGGENGDGWRVGTYNENNIYDVYLYKYSAADGINAGNDTPVTLLAYEKNIDFTPSPSDADTNGKIVKELTFKVGDYHYEPSNHDHFIVAINTEVMSTNTTLGKLRDELVTLTCRQNGSQMKDYDLFTMSNAHDSEFKGGQGTETNPYIVDIDVERTTARIDFAYSVAAMSAGKFRIEDGNYVYKVNGSSEDEVVLSHVRATNVMQNAPYLIKRLAATESDVPDYLANETNPATQYVVEPTTWSKTVQAVENNTLDFVRWFRDSWYMNAVNTYQSTTTPWFRPDDRVHCGSGDAFTDGTNLDEKDFDWQYYVLSYANENTMQAAHTLHHYTTGLILKATYVPQKIYKAVDPIGGTLTLDAAYTKGATFWRWHDIDTNTDVFFSNEAAAEAYKALHPHSIVYPYNDAQCYYNVWLRHENIIDDPTTTTMEFGIVRNNIYRVCVEFTGIGMPDIPDDMTTPENIRMFIYVRKWNLIEHPAIEI